MNGIFFLSFDLNEYELLLLLLFLSIFFSLQVNILLRNILIINQYTKYWWWSIFGQYTKLNFKLKNKYKILTLNHI